MSDKAARKAIGNFIQTAISEMRSHPNGPFTTHIRVQRWDGTVQTFTISRG